MNGLMGMLTETEMEIAGWLVEGYSARGIAEVMPHLAYRTIKNHLYRMYRKFGIKGGIKEVRLAMMLVNWERGN